MQGYNVIGVSNFEENEEIIGTGGDRTRALQLGLSYKISQSDTK